MLKDKTTQLKPKSSNKGQKTIKIFQDKTSPTRAAGLEGDWNRKIIPASMKSREKQENKVEATTWVGEGVAKKAVPPKTKLLIECRPEGSKLFNNLNFCDFFKFKTDKLRIGL